MKIALIVIGRLENQYAREWVFHHLALGFDRIIICDNNHDGEERFEDVLKDCIETRRVTVLNYRNIEKAQRRAYNDCYEYYNRQYDWLAFFDFDEFLCINKNLPQNIHTLMELYDKKWQAVMVPWLTMTDSGLVYNDHRPCMERFIEVNLQESIAAKGIVRGGIDGIRFTKSVHIPMRPTLRICDTLGNAREQNRFGTPNTDVCYLKHFTTKTVEEFVNNKWRKGAAGVTYEKFRRQYADYFFRINERTPEKEDYIKQHMK